MLGRSSRLQLRALSPEQNNNARCNESTDTASDVNRCPKNGRVRYLDDSVLWMLTQAGNPNNRVFRLGPFDIRPTSQNSSLSGTYCWIDMLRAVIRQTRSNAAMVRLECRIRFLKIRHPIYLADTPQHPAVASLGSSGSESSHAVFVARRHGERLFR